MAILPDGPPAGSPTSLSFSPPKRRKAVIFEQELSYPATEPDGVANRAVSSAAFCQFLAATAACNSYFRQVFW